MTRFLCILMIAACGWAVSVCVNAAVYWQAYGNTQSRDLCLILGFAFVLGVLMFTGPLIIRQRT